ncbi:MAG: metal-dependent transcriptional regulator [Bacilli bacterium]|nr:metal-dependent transcriptional regulator [Bacilli bacterium]
MNHLESSEDYLERILMLHKKNSVVRAIDLANEMNFSKASISIALKKLRDRNYIFVNKSDGNIILTAEGESLAKSVYEKHVIISKVLIALGVNEDIALKDACKVEHDLSEETFEAIKKHYEEHVVIK